MTLEGSIQNRTIQALDTFAKQDPKKGRVLLKLVHEGGKTGLTAVRYSDLTLYEKLSLVFSRGDYKLQRIVAFLESDSFRVPGGDMQSLELVKKAGGKLYDKVQSHNNRLVTQLFYDTISPMYDSFDTAIRLKLKKEEIAARLTSWIAHPGDEATLNDIVKQLEEVQNDPLIKKLYDEARSKLKRTSAAKGRSQTAPTLPASSAGPSVSRLKTVAAGSILTKGAGIYNPSTSCYLNATLQALRFCPPFREHLAATVAVLDARGMQRSFDAFKKAVGSYEIDFAEKLELALREGKEGAADELLKNHPSNIQITHQKKIELLAYMLAAMYDQLEGKKSGRPKEIDRATIQAFRQLIINLGFGDQHTDLNTQEDAADVCQFLFDRLGVPQFGFRFLSEYDQSAIGCRVAALEPQRADTGSMAYVEVPDSKTTLAALLFKTPVQETLLKRELLNTDGITEDQKHKISYLPERIVLDTKKTFVFEKGKEPPKWLPICLRRYELTASGIKKKTTEIVPDEVLEIPVEGTDKKVRYRLQAVAIHDGKEPKFGHYYSYVARRAIDQKPGWIEYNDTNVVEHATTGPVKDILEKGYLFMYTQMA